VHIFKVCNPIVLFCTNVGRTYPYKYATHVFSCSHKFFRKHQVILLFDLVGEE
jgi:hypothetical protein